MTTLELLIAILSPSIVLMIFLLNTFQRMAKMETKIDFMIKWIAALNGEMSDKKEFKEFLEELKEIAKEKGL